MCTMHALQGWYGFVSRVREVGDGKQQGGGAGRGVAGEIMPALRVLK